MKKRYLRMNTELLCYFHLILTAREHITGQHSAVSHICYIINLLRKYSRKVTSKFLISDPPSRNMDNNLRVASLRKSEFKYFIFE